MSVRRVLVLALLALAAGAPAAQADATFATKADWGAGFTGTFTLDNDTNVPVDQWRLEFDLAPGQRLTSAWGALITRTDQHYVLTPVAYTRTVAPGATVTLGFEGSEETGPFVPPLNCRFNGLPCDAAMTTSAASSSGSMPPMAPTGLEVAARAPTAITLHWAAGPTSIASYDVLRDGRKVATATTTNVAVGGLHPGHRYRFAIRAVDTTGARSPASASLTTTTPSAAPTPNGPLTVDYASVDDWGTGYVGSLVIRNHGLRPINGWQLTLELPPGSTLDSAWNAGLIGSGTQATLTPAFWTKKIAPGGSVYLGFSGTTAGPFFPGPAACKINGRPCVPAPVSPPA